jgi:hypothetical protein
MPTGGEGPGPGYFYRYSRYPLLMHEEYIRNQVIQVPQ